MPPQRPTKKSKPDDARSAKPAAQPAVKPAAPAVSPAPLTTLARAVDPAELSAASPEQVRLLNRAVGNRALNRLLASKTIQAKLTVGPADDRYEQEADRSADAVMRSAQAPAAAAGQPWGDDEPVQRQALDEDEPLQRAPAAAPVVGLEGGETGSAVEAQLAASRGGGAPLPEATRAQMETGLGADFSGVRVHTGPEADSLNQALGAQAFTHGADVYMGAGKYAPGSSDGQRLLAHELTHVVQQGAGPVRRRPAAGPLAETDAAGVIHRKLAGTTEALTALGNRASVKSQLKSKLATAKAWVGMSNTTEGSGKYAQVLSRLAAYEKQEAKYVASGRDTLTADEKRKLFAELKEIELVVRAWLAENVELATSAEDAADKVRNQSPEEIAADEKPEHQRYHAMKLLLPRLRHEQLEIVRGDFFRTTTWSDKTLDRGQSQDDAFGGEVNRLDQVTHGGERGVFTQDKTWADALNVGTKLGISAVDPNQGARSVAMYQLAQLLNLGVDVIAQTEFATHTSTTGKQNQPLAQPMAKMGVRQAMAPGTEAAQTPAAISTADALARGGDTISLEDPVLQRSLNAIQLIDAIAGQVDRHWHNYYIATDGHGQVQGVVGIDLDMAFAPDHRTVAPATQADADPLKGSHFVGMPRLVDSQFAQRIVAISADDVAGLLRNYLSGPEVAAALERFNLVQEACRGVLERNEAVLPGGWNAQTAEGQLAEPGTNYLSSMASGLTKHEFAQPAQELTWQQINVIGARRRMEPVIQTLERFIWSKVLSAAECLAVVQAVVSNYLAADEPDRLPLLDTLATTPVRTWNNVLQNPAANGGVLAKAQ